MIITCRINDETTFKLARWSNQDFRDSLILTLQTIDLPAVKQVFSHINKVEIYNDNNLVAIFTAFDTFSSINYLGTIYVEHEQIFTDAISVSLSKINIVEQVERLDKQVNPVIDIESMNLNEYKEYQLAQVSEACTTSIYEGDYVLLSDGSTEKFSFTDKDQTDLQSLSSIAMMDPNIELTWHSDGNLCRFYSGIDIILIYQSLNMKLFRNTTICNAINQLIRNASSKGEVSLYYWGCELPTADQERIDYLISKMVTIVNEIISKFIPEESTPTQPIEPTEPSEEEPTEPETNEEPINDNDNEENTTTEEVEENN